MGEELNSQDSSQSAAQVVEPNAENKPAEPVVTGAMTESQSSDYYNKTQQLATERRAFEEERSRYQAPAQGQQDQGYSTPANPYANNGYPAQYNNQGQQFQQPAQQYQQQPASALIPPETAKALVEQFGFDGANSIVKVAQSLTQPLMQQFSQTQAQVHETQRASLESQINTQAVETYGKEQWNAVKGPAMELIKTYGMPLKHAYNAVNAERVAQQATNQAYANQAQKTAGNVQTQTVQPSTQSAPVINTVGDAFRDAMKQHAS